MVYLHNIINISTIVHFNLEESKSRVVRSGHNVGQLEPKWDKSGHFSDHISVYKLKSDLKKPRICPIWGPIWPTLEPNLPSLGDSDKLSFTDRSACCTAIASHRYTPHRNLHPFRSSRSFTGITGISMHFDICIILYGLTWVLRIYERRTQMYRMNVLPRCIFSMILTPARSLLTTPHSIFILMNNSSFNPRTVLGRFNRPRKNVCSV